MNDALGSPQSVLVFGATSDLARAILRRLVARRARHLVLAARDPERLKETATELEALGATRVETVPFEATDTGGHQALVDGIFAGGGDLDLVLIAFGTLGDPERDARDAAAAARVAAVNYAGAVSVGAAVAGHLRRQGHGTLAVLSSVAGVVVRPANFVYGSSKAGMDAFFTGLRDVVAPDGVRVLVVRPGFVHTRMTEGRRPAPFATTADDVAGWVLRGLETRADVVWAPPVLRWVMAVLALAPRRLLSMLGS